MKCKHCGAEFEHDGWELEEVLALAQCPTVGMRADDARAFWANFARVGWIDAAGRKVVNLRAAMIHWKATTSSHGRRQAQPMTASQTMFQASQQLRALDAQMQEFTTRNHYPDRWTDEQREWFAKARAKAKELRSQMGGV